MSIRTVLVVALALVLGLSAALGIGALRPPAPSSTKPETVSIVVATAEIPRFGTVTSAALTTRECPKDLAPPGALTRVEDAVDRVALSAVIKDEPLLESRLASRGTGRGMAPGIQKGKRAFTILASNVSTGVAGFILPGNNVDILLTLGAHGGNDPLTGTITLLQNIEILAVDQRVDVPADAKVDPRELRSVTLLVTPDEAAKLDLGQNKGILHLALRNPQDTAAVNVRRATLADIGVPEPKKVETPVVPAAAPSKPETPPPPARIRTMRGSLESEVLIYYPPPAAGNGR